MRFTSWFAAFAVALLVGATGARAESPDRLGEILIPGEEWQVVAEDLGFSDGPSCDAEGNFYFSDLKAKPPGVFKVTPDGQKTKVVEAGMSGTKFGPDGRLYGVGGGKLTAVELPSGKMTVITDGLSTNDLAISHKGHAYLTETGKKQVTFVDLKTGEKRVADTGITKPNGIALSPDQNTLFVSDYGGLNVWSFRIQPDGTLAEKKPLMTMKAPETKPDVAGGDGMVVDTLGRCYVTSALGIQVFDAGGALMGILPKPQPGTLTSVGMAGKEMGYLYATNGTKVFRRKVKAKGFVTFNEPMAAGK